MNRILRFAAVAAMGAISSLVAMAASGRGSDVSFQGEVRRIEQESADKGKIVVRLNGAELPVWIDAETQIDSQGNIIKMEDLDMGHYVQVIGFFSPSGVVAKEVQLFDDRGAEFRIRGTIDSVERAGAQAVIRIGTATILAGDSTKIVRRGTEDRWNASQLESGQEIDVRGTLEDGRFVAGSMLVGKRLDDGITVRFDGTLQKVEGRRLVLDTKGGGTAVVVMDDSTVVKGDFSKETEFEVSGKLNENLEVEADWVRSEASAMDDHGNHPEPGDDNGGNPSPNPAPVAVRKGISLAATPAGSGMSGHADIAYETISGEIEQQFEVEFEDAQPGQAYQIEVGVGSAGTVSGGSVTADDRGRAKVKFTNKPGVGRNLGSLLPAGKDVRNISGVRVLLSSVAVLTGQF